MMSCSKCILYAELSRVHILVYLFVSKYSTVKNGLIEDFNIFGDLGGVAYILLGLMAKAEPKLSIRFQRMLPP